MKKNAVAFLLLLSFPPLWFPILFDKIHSVYESHVQSTGRRGPYLHTGYILFQLLRLLGKEAKAEEFNNFGKPSSSTHRRRWLAQKTLELAITNDSIWSQVCGALGWKYLPTV